MLWAAGAKEIHMRISAPPFVSACYYGTDIDNTKGLIANKHSIEGIAKIIGVTSLGYLRMEDVRLLTGKDTGFCTACFDGKYPVCPSVHSEKSRFENKISENKKG